MSFEDKTEPLHTQVLASYNIIPGLNVLTCSLKELQLHCPSCVSGTAPNGVLSSSQRRKFSRAPCLLPVDILAQLTVEQIVMSRKPTLIDHLIYQNKAALIMESRSRNRGAKNIKAEPQNNGKRKVPSTDELTDRKRLRSSKPEVTKNVQKTVQKAKKRKPESEPPATNRYATRISINKVRIPFSLRSGRKMAEMLKAKRKCGRKQHLQQNIADKKLSQLDSNSNAFSSTMQPVDKIKTDETEVKPKRKRRKRCSMWVNKKVGKRKPARKTEELPVLKKVESGEEDEKIEFEEELEPLMPTLVKEVENGDVKFEEMEVKNEMDSSIVEFMATNDKIENETFDLITEVPACVKQENIRPLNYSDLTKVEESKYCMASNDDQSEKQSSISEDVNDTIGSDSTNRPLTDCCRNTDIELNSLAETDKVPVSQTNGIPNSVSEIVETEFKSSESSKERDVQILRVGDELTKECLKIHNDSNINGTETEGSIGTNEDKDVAALKNAELGDDCINTERLLTISLEPSSQKRSELDVGKQNELNLIETMNVDDEEPPEEIHPHEADSTSDVAPFTTSTPVREELPKLSDSELMETCVSEVSVLPDSTKEVKPVGLDVKLEKDDILGDSLLNVQNSNESPSLIREVKSESGTPDVTELCDANKLSTVDSANNSVERKQMKESVLQALGLKSAASEDKQLSQEEKQKCAQQQQKNNTGYTGTLKAVIKLNRTGDKKRTMVYKRNEDALSTSDKLEYRICSDLPSAETVPITHLADMAYNKKGFHHKSSESVTNSIYVNTNNGLSHIDEGDTNGEDPKGNKESNLIIPEKSSSFSIHPGRLCSDVCSYCFGKFGSLDTPCHVAQIKSEERQKKILLNEPHLTPESCLCDACYRYVDRKVNYHPKSGSQPGTSAANTSSNKAHHQPQPQTSCCVVRCSQPATHTIKRKGILKLKKSLTNKLDIDMDKHSGLYFPFCSQHHYWVEYLTVCGICRKRLNRNNLFSLGSETDKLNLMLAEDGIPARLSDNLFLCKLCRYYSNLRLKYSDASSIPAQNKAFYKSYRRKILMSLDIAVSNSEDECDNSEDSNTPEKKHCTPRNLSVSSKVNENGANTSVDNPSTSACLSNKDNTASEDMVSLTELATLFGDQPAADTQQTRIQVKFGNVNIGTLSNLNIGQQGSSSAPVTANTDQESSGGILSCNLDFKGTAPGVALERCVTTIQFDKKAKQLWTELQKPYGTQSLFLRHLIMMEKIWRAGHLALSANADEKAIRYVLNARNKVHACESSSGTNTSVASSPSPTIAAPVNPAKPKDSSTIPQPIHIRQQLQQPPLQKLQSKPPPLPLPLQTVMKPVPTKQPIPPLSPVVLNQERFPSLPNNGEIEVMPVRTTQTIVSPRPSLTVTASVLPPLPQQLKASINQPHRPNLPSNSQTHSLIQQQLMARRLTPLDRAKSLVRMALPPRRSIPPPRSVPPPPPRYYVPVQNTQPGAPKQYILSGGSSIRAPPPPLMKLQSFYQHQQQLNQQSAIHNPYQQQSHVHQHPLSAPSPRKILPKLPKSLTVVSRTNNAPTAITLQHSGITIEKQSSSPAMRSSHPLPVEKPIISVFREPAITPQQH